MDREQSLRYIELAMQTELDSGFARYAVELKENGEFVDMCGFAPVKDYIDLGYRFAKTTWGRDSQLRLQQRGLSLALLKEDLAR